METKTIFSRSNVRKVEAWTLSLAFGFFIFAFLIDSQSDYHYAPWRFTENHIRYNYYENFFFPSLVQAIIAYSALLVTILVIEPIWEREKAILKSLGLFSAVVFTAWIGIAISLTYSDAWKFGKYLTTQRTYDRIFFNAATLCLMGALIYGAYYLIKQVIGIFLSRVDRSDPKKNALISKIQIVTLLWLIIFIFLLVTNFPTVITVTWFVMIPYSAFIIYTNRYMLIPNAATPLVYDSGYLLKLILIVVILDIIASGVISGAIGMNYASTITAFFLIIIWTAVVLIPFSFYLYKNAADKSVLTRALGKSDASLSFLKSQINPHFLFNALNTLYGTALQENAERTGEGIQKLGDMMRFMLQENVQDKISLMRDIDYLNNYIDLQKLRTSRSADITIETQIDEQLNNLEISPMLLIPFVENAFKHGISLQEPSHIKVTLQTREKTLYFDVHNSIHIKSDTDPEKLKSGIGLKNVKQRLALLYPGKHELIIRESAKEFFIHLTLNLN